LRFSHWRRTAHFATKSVFASINAKRNSFDVKGVIQDTTNVVLAERNHLQIFGRESYFPSGTTFLKGEEANFSVIRAKIICGTAEFYLNLVSPFKGSTY